MIFIHSVANLASAVVKDLQPALPCLSQTSVGCFDKRAGGGGVTKGVWLSKRSKADWYKQWHWQYPSHQNQDYNPHIYIYTYTYIHVYIHIILYIYIYVSCFHDRTVTPPIRCARWLSRNHRTTGIVLDRSSQSAALRTRMVPEVIAGEWMFIHVYS